MAAGNIMDADIAWESFRKGSGIRKASVSEKLDAIAGQLNDIRTDADRTATLVPKIMGDQTVLDNAGEAGPAPEAEAGATGGNPTEEGTMPPSTAMPADGAVGDIAANGENDMANEDKDNKAAGPETEAPAAADTGVSPEAPIGAGTPGDNGAAGAPETGADTGGKTPDEMSDEEIDAFLNDNGGAEGGEDAAEPPAAEGGEEAAAPEAETAPAAGGSKVMDAIKQVAETAIEENDAATLRDVADILDKVGGGNAAPAPAAEPEAEGAGEVTKSATAPVAECGGKKKIETGPVAECSGTKKAAETAPIAECSGKQQKPAASTAPVAESEGPEVNEALGAGSEPVIGADTGGAGEVCPMCGADIKSKFGLPDDIDLDGLAQALMHMKSDDGEAEGKTEIKGPSGEPQVVEIEVESKDKDDAEKEGGETEAKEEAGEEATETPAEEKKEEAVEEIGADKFDKTAKMGFRDLYSSLKSRNCGVDGKPAKVRTSKVTKSVTGSGDEGTAGNTLQGAGGVDTAPAAPPAAPPTAPTAPAVPTAGTTPVPADPVKSGVPNEGNADAGSGTVGNQAAADTAPANEGIGGDFVKTEGKHIATMREMLQVRKSGAQENRPSDASAVNADLSKPDLGRINKSLNTTPQIRMGHGVDPHKVVENDIREYNLFKSQKGF